VLVLLPPSEGKALPTGGPPLDLRSLSLPRLTPARRTVLTALARLCRTDPTTARAVLGLSERQATEVTRNAGLRRAPTAPAAQLYTGVLYGALDHAGADRAVRARLDDWVLVASGLWGMVRLDDRIPAYRLPGGTTLPGPGRLATFWRDPLARALAPMARDDVVLDLRSGTYAAAWAPPPERTVVVRVVHDRQGTRTVASHANKATKGRLLRALATTLVASPDPDTPAALVDAIRAAGLRAETHPRAGAATPLLVDVVVSTPDSRSDGADSPALPH
jgi:cytoplasmic iron level regulating protein YaaA (DUF328/UPF0246 family)